MVLRSYKAWTNKIKMKKRLYNRLAKSNLDECEASMEENQPAKEKITHNSKLL